MQQSQRQILHLEMMKNSLILITSELETRKHLLRLT